MTQAKLLDSPQFHPVHDFIGCLPDKVMPTPVRILERNGKILMVRHYDHGQKITGGQVRLWQTVVKLGEAEGSKGAATVLCIVGWAGGARPCHVFNHQGRKEHAWTKDDIQAYVRGWWHDARH